MQVTNFILGAGGSARIALGGNYFRLLTAAAVVTVRLYRKGRPFAEAVGILGGYWAKPDDGFDEVEIVSASAQTVVVGTIYGTGGYDRAQGDVNITGSTGAAGVQGPRAQASAQVLGDLPVLTREMGFVYGASFASGALLASVGTEQIIAAATNVNGVHVWDVDIMTGPLAAGSSIVSLHAHTVVPAAIGDGNIIAMVGATASSAAGIVSSNTAMVRPKFIAPGKGLWFFNSGGQPEGGSRRRVLYTVY